MKTPIIPFDSRSGHAHLARINHTLEPGARASCPLQPSGPRKRARCPRAGHVALLLVSWLLGSGLAAAADAGTTAEVKNLSFNGGLEDGKARLVIEAILKGLPGDSEKAVFSTVLQHSIKITRDKLTNYIAATFDILAGEPK